MCVIIVKEEMRVPSKKVTRIFVARIPQSVTKSTFQRLSFSLFLSWKEFYHVSRDVMLIFFCSHFEKYGEITDLYMPKVFNVAG